MQLMNDDMLTQIYRFDISKNALVRLEKSYSSKSRVKVIQVKKEMQNLKKGNQTISECILKIR